MKHLYVQALMAMSGMMCLSGCTGEVVNESTVSEPAGVLRVMTRSGDEGTTPLSGASVYLFNSSGACVSILSSETTGAYASAKLPAGTYTLYAWGGDGLSGLVLPTQAQASSSYALTLAENQSLGDLLMKEETVTLADGDNETVDMTLERKVIEISSVTITQVPEDISGVQVSVAPLYGQVQLNGEYVASSTAPCVITLTSQGSGTWAASPQLITFPSKSKPVITITFTAEGADPRSYSYTANEALEANHKFNLEGTYTEPLGVTITGTITAQAWESGATDITFDFDESNSGTSSTEEPSSGTEEPSGAPVAGETYKGCYVVSVNTEARTAVLLSPTDQSGYTEDTSAKLLPLLNASLASWPSVSGVTGTWRIPTIEEVRLFAFDSDLMDDVVAPNRKYLICYKGSELSRITVKKIYPDGSIEVQDPSDMKFSSQDILRPVIDISYQ